MRKYIVGGLVGLLIGLSATAYADDIGNLIGKKIQGQSTVYLDGNKLDTAIIVDGKSYAPTRRVAEAAGKRVAFKEGGIYLETQETPIVTTDPLPATGGATEPSKEDKIKGIEGQIYIVNGEIHALNVSIAVSRSSEDIAKLKISLAEKQQQLVDLESQKAELEAK